MAIGFKNLKRRWQGRWLTRLNSVTLAVSEKQSLQRKGSFKKMQGWSVICAIPRKDPGPPLAGRPSECVGHECHGRHTAPEPRGLGMSFQASQYLWTLSPGSRTRDGNHIRLPQKVSDGMCQCFENCERLYLWNLYLKKGKEKSHSKHGPGISIEENAGGRNERTKEMVSQEKEVMGCLQERDVDRDPGPLGVKMMIWPNPKQAEFWVL